MNIVALVLGGINLIFGVVFLPGAFLFAIPNRFLRGFLALGAILSLSVGSWIWVTRWPF